MNRALINASGGIVQKPLRYVLYVRKSSEDAEAQAKSLPDQIADCKEYANNHGLLLVGEPIQESKSAKKSGNRPLFSQMLKDIEKGKYDAILAWHPDRLSRNSLEAADILARITSIIDVTTRPVRVQITTCACMSSWTNSTRNSAVSARNTTLQALSTT